MIRHNRRVFIFGNQVGNLLFQPVVRCFSNNERAMYIHLLVVDIIQFVCRHFKICWSRESFKKQSIQPHGKLSLKWSDTYDDLIPSIAKIKSTTAWKTKRCTVKANKIKIFVFRAYLTHLDRNAWNAYVKKESYARLLYLFTISAGQLSRLERKIEFSVFSEPTICLYRSKTSMRMCL